MATPKPKHILIAPLDWGLGHTTRCVPLIRHISSLGHVPVVAGNCSQRSFIEETFGAIDFIHLEGYNITYSKWNKVAQAGLLSQLPEIHKTIEIEHKWLQQICRERQIDGIISDNRYGLFHSGTPSVIMTHQLQVQTGLGNFADRAIQKIHYKYLNRFNATWVVDGPGTPNLGGKLSHSPALPNHTKYIGLLSQFAEMEFGNMPIGSQVRNLEFAPLLILLSGPEPQRSILSQILWQQVLDHKGKVIFIEGNKNARRPEDIPLHINWYNRLTSDDLAPVLRNAGMVICRSGYSTLMDLAALHKKAILIPTPGQTEQEYLGKHLHTQGIFYGTKQDGFNLKIALEATQQFSYRDLEISEYYTSYKKVIENWIATL